MLRNRPSRGISLLDHVLSLLVEMDRRYQERWESQSRDVQLAMESLNRRLDLLNELRTGVATREQMDLVNKEVSTLQRRMERAEGKSSGIGTMWGVIVAVAGIVIAIISWLTR